MTKYWSRNRSTPGLGLEETPASSALMAQKDADLWRVVRRAAESAMQGHAFRMATWSCVAPRSSWLVTGNPPSGESRVLTSWPTRNVRTCGSATPAGMGRSG